tara:strand:- start:75 stop:581 length:507 start_codon:yes stop_codon:yes gene_type:complete
MKNNNSKVKITDEMIDTILYKLKIISHLKQGDKLYCYDDNIFIDNSYIPSVSRYINNQNRTESMAFITDCIENVIYITDFIYRNELSVKKNIKEKETRNINNFFKESNDKILKKFYIKLTNSIEGLNNLKLTYNDDLSIKTTIDLLIQKIQTRISKIDSILIISLSSS